MGIELRNAWRLAGLVALLVAVTLIVTYPQAAHLRTGVHDFGDPFLNAWALAWVPHAIVTQPTALFDANAFFPERGTLALSETLLLPALLVAPLRALGANAILLHNVTLLSGYVLSGLSMFFLVRSLTGENRGALLAAVAFAACPLRAEHYPRVQLQLTYLMPVALLLMFKLLERERRMPTAGLLGVTIGLLFYSCVYYSMYFAVLLVVVVAVHLALQPREALRRVGALVAAALVTAAIVAPAVPVYLRNRQVAGERAIEDVRPGSAELRDYLRPTPQNWWYRGREGGPAERHLFTGYVVPATALVAIATPAGRWLPIATGLAAGVDISLGLNGHLYRGLYEYAVPFRALRVPARMAVLVNMFAAVLAGLGCAHAMSRMPSNLVRNTILTLLVGGTVLESLNRPLSLRDAELHGPAVYEWLRGLPPEPIVEYPAGGLEGRIGPQDATYMYYSTVHWRPLLNGYSGFEPPSHVELLERLREFPEPGSLDYLRGRGARYLLVHERFYLRGGFDADAAALDHAVGVTRLAAFTDRSLGRTYVYDLRPSR